MKVLPISFNTYFPKVQTFRHQALSSDTFQLSFGGYVDYAMDSSEVHCPVCNVKMLSEKDYNLLVDRAGEVNSTLEFMNLLREYKDYIPQNMREILNSPDDIPLNDLLIMNGRNACHKHEDNIKEAVDFFTDYAKNLPSEKRELVLKTMETIKPRESNFHFREKMIPLILSLGITNEENYKISKNIFPKISLSNDFWSVFKIKDSDKLPVNELSKELIRRIFKNSTLTKRNITVLKGTEENNNNEILLCNGCNRRSSAKTFLPLGALENDSLKDSLRTYIQDISFISGSNNRETNIPYIKMLCNFISNISQQKIKFENHEIHDMKSVNYSAARHEIFAPINQTKVDLNCADCGTVMMPHEVKTLLLKDLANASELKDYSAIIHKYEKYIGPYSHFIADTFLEIAQKNPDLSEDDFIELLQKKVDKYSLNEVKKTLYLFRRERSYILENKSLEDLNKVDKIFKRMCNYVKSGQFDDFQYTKMFDAVFYDIDINNNSLTPVYTACSNFRKIGYINALAKPNYYDTLHDKNKFHTIVFNIFKPDFATADHLLPRSKNGSYTKENLIGLCKACNSVNKGQKHTLSWLNKSPRVKYNLTTQLIAVDGMSKRGEIEGYEGWAKSIADTMYVLTKGKYDVRDKFSK